MKKLLQTLLIYLSLILLVACGGNPPDINNRGGEKKVTSYTGVIEAIDLSVYKEGTHELKTEDGDILTIESPKINLNNYINKKVLVKGLLRTLIDNKTQVLTVDEIELKDIDTLSEWLDFKDKKMGYTFSYPPFWQLVDDKVRILKSNGNDWVTITTFLKVDVNLAEFVSSKEEGLGDEVIVGNQKALRFMTGDKIRIYVPNASKKKVYLITFNGLEDKRGEQKKAFYDFLETFMLTSSANTPTGKLCGGIKKIVCAENFRCELSSTKKYAEGVCVGISTDIKNNCPFVPKPKGCLNYEVKSTNKNNCPLSYVCLDEPADEDDKEVEAKDFASDVEGSKKSPDESTETQDSAYVSQEERVISVFKKYQSKILPAVKKIDRFEVDGVQRLLAVEYKNGEEWRLIYKYSPSGNEFNFQKTTEYKRNSQGEWGIQKGDPVELKSIIDTSDQRVKKDRRTDLRFYDNPYKDFSVGYPNNWYFRSFGAIENSVWTVGFSENELKEVSSASIRLMILDGAKLKNRQVKSGDYWVTLPRDNNSHFLIKGSIILKTVIDQIADSVENKL